MKDKPDPDEVSLREYERELERLKEAEFETTREIVFERMCERRRKSDE